jgi:hypothetical protein
MAPFFVMAWLCTASRINPHFSGNRIDTGVFCKKYGLGPHDTGQIKDGNHFTIFIFQNSPHFIDRGEYPMQGEPFAIYIFDPGCPACCCNECGEEFTWDGQRRPSCPSCDSKDIRSA